MATDGLDRRDFLTLSMAGVAGSQLLRPPMSRGDAEQPSPVEIVDTHLYLGQWPFRQTPGNSAAEAVAMLRQNGVVRAWAGTFEGLLHKDVSSANARLAEACRRGGEGLLVPFGVVNPMLPDWEEDVRRCHEVFKMPGLRLHPNYHGYTLANDRFAKLLALATKQRMLVQLVTQLDDSQHAYLRMPSERVDLSPLGAVIQQFPELRLTLHNRPERFSVAQLGALPAATNVILDVTAVADSNAIPANRLVLGSCWPLAMLSAIVPRVRDTFASGADANRVYRDTARGLLRR